MSNVFVKEQNVGTDLGAVMKWVVSASEEVSTSVRDTAYALGMNSDTLRMLLALNGAVEYGSYFAFDTKEAAENAMKMIGVKMELDETSPETSRSAVTSPPITLQIEVTQELVEEIADDNDISIQELLDTEDSDGQEAWYEYLSDNGIDLADWQSDYYMTIETIENGYKVTVKGRL